MSMAACTVLGIVHPEALPADFLLQEQGHGYRDGWWRILVLAGGVCLEDKVLPVPSLNPHHLGQVGAWPSSDLS